MMSSKGLIAAVSALLLAGAPGAAVALPSLGATGLAMPRLIVPTTADINDPYFLQGASNYSGVGGVIVNTRDGDKNGYALFCTGSLINTQVVVTAGHCFDGVAPTRVRFRTGSGTLASDRVNYEAGHYWIHPNFDIKTFYAGWDIATIVLKTPRHNGEQIYAPYDEAGNDLFGQPSGERFQIHTKVGFGTLGTLANGGQGFDALKRAGQNSYEFFGDELFGDVNNQVLFYDSDNSNSQNDAFGFVWQSVLGSAARSVFSDTGVYYSATLDAFAFGAADGTLPDYGVTDWRLVESNAAPGDSGGPTFIDGKIAGITSFGSSGAIFDGDCGPGYIDPSFEPGPTYPSNPSDYECTNSSAGEIGADTRVSAFLHELGAFQQYNGNIRALNRSGIGHVASVPEPGALALFGLWALALAGVRRRAR